MFSTINFELNIEKPENLTSRLTLLDFFLCPSDDAPPLIWATFTPEKSFRLLPGDRICQVASSNYVAMFGLGEPGVEGEGLFYRNSSVRLNHITDGTGQTIAAGERSFNLGEATWVGSVTGATLAPPAGATVGRPRVEPGPGMTLGHAGEGLGPGDYRSDVNMFFSRHGQGVNYVFADGHVSFLKTTMDRETYFALATRAGGETISGEY